MMKSSKLLHLYLEPVIFDMELVHQLAAFSAVDIEVILLLLAAVAHQVRLVRGPADLNIFLVRVLKLKLLLPGGKQLGLDVA